MTGRATVCTAEGDSWKSEVTSSGEKNGRPADPSSANIENMVSGVAEVAGAAVGAGAGAMASGGAPTP
jgi:hypothetical protein